MPGHRGAERAGLDGLDAGHRVGPGGAGLGLSVGVDHRGVVGLRGPGEGVDVERLALHRDDLQPERVRGGQVVAELAQHPPQRRRGQDLGDLVPLADLVEPRVGRGVQRALVAGDRHAAGESADHGLDREGQPADVGGDPVHVALLVADLPVRVGPGAEQEAADRVHDALGLGLRARGEDQERRGVRVQRHRGERRRRRSRPPRCRRPRSPPAARRRCPCGRPRPWPAGSGSGAGRRAASPGAGPACRGGRSRRRR